MAYARVDKQFWSRGNRPPHTLLRRALVGAEVSGRRRLAALVVVVMSVVATLLGGVPAQADGVRAASAASSASGSAAPLAERVKFGAFVAGMYGDPSLLSDFEEQMGRETDVASYYYAYAGAGEGSVFPGSVELGFADGGRRDVLVAWDMGPTRFTEWTAGVHDAYLDRIAAAAREYPYDLYVRPWPEMNGDWAAYQPTIAGNRPHGGTYREFKLAWRYVVTYLRSAGADNLKWVFNVDASTYAGTTPVEKIWPGRRYVDVLGLDGFNWGQDAGWGRWRSFGTIFAKQYRRITALHPTAPVWICEVGSKEPLVDDGAPVDTGHSKASWMRSALNYEGMPRLAAVVWFNMRKERDWRLDSSPAAGSTARRLLTTS